MISFARGSVGFSESANVENGEIKPEKYRETLESYVEKYVMNIKTNDISGALSGKLKDIQTK